LRVAKTARYYTLGEAGQNVEELWIVCHGFGQLARGFIEEFGPIATPRRLIVAPEALSHFYRSPGNVHGPDTPVGATWMTREDRENEIQDYVGYLETLCVEVLRTVPNAVHLIALGFSQGAATASRWVAASSRKFEKVILWGGLLPPEFNSASVLGGLRDNPIQFVIGKTDRYFSAELVERERERVTKLGLKASFTQFSGGHTVDQPTLNAVASAI
jgi:predicted esterase